MTILVEAPPSPLYLQRRTPTGKLRWGNDRGKCLAAAVDVPLADKVMVLAQARGLTRSEFIYHLFKTIDEHDLWDVLLDGPSSVASVRQTETQKSEE